MSVLNVDSAYIQIDDTAYNRVFHSWSGPVGRDLLKRGARLATFQRAEAGYRTGKLKSSISIHREIAGPEFPLSLRVGANPTGAYGIGYGYYQQKGTEPHSIYPRRAQALRFFYGERLVITQHVRHPGNRPNPYLTKHLREVMK